MPAKAYSTKGLKIWLGPKTAPAEVAPTAISAAKPAVVTAAGLTLQDGDVAYVSNTGFAELDGKWFVVGEASAVSFTLIGSDTTGTTGALAADPLIEVHSQGEAFALDCLAKTITFNSDAPAAVPAGTYCDPSLSIVSPIMPPSTIEFGGNINVEDPAYAELLKASEDGAQRAIDIALPFEQGDIVAPGAVALVTWDLPIDGVMGFTTTITCATKPMHRF